MNIGVLIQVYKIQDDRAKENCYPQKGIKLYTRISELKGTIYLIHCQGSHYYKIGLTTGDVKARLSGMQTNCPYPLKLIISADKKDYERVEAKLHEWLREFNVSGEWFILSPQILEKVVYKIKYE